MSANVGLSTPRGSGTSGYVQRNLSVVRPRDRDRSAPYSMDQYEKHKQRKPDKDILEHERKRKIEVKCFELRDKLEEEGVDEDEIDDQVDALRKKLTKEAERGGRSGGDARGLKAHQVHDLAEAKIQETERVRKAFGISKDYEEGSHWRRQEERKKEFEAKKEKERTEEEEALVELERLQRRKADESASREPSSEPEGERRKRYSDSEEDDDSDRSE
jgi:hypothetical protein